MSRKRKFPPRKAAQSFVSGKVLALLREGGLIVLLGAAAYLALCLLTYSPSDPGPTHTGSGAPIANMGGRVGAWFADLMFALFGRAAYLFLLLLCACGWRVYRDHSPAHASDAARQSRVSALGFPILGLFMSLIGACGLAQMYFPLPPGADFVHEAGGGIGASSAIFFTANFGAVGASVIFLALLIAGMPLVTHLSWFALMDETGYLAFVFAARAKAYWQTRADRAQGKKVRQERRVTVKQIRDDFSERTPPKIEPKIDTPPPGARSQKDKQTTLLVDQAAGELPSLSLLEPPIDIGAGYSHAELESMSQILMKKLKDFNVDVSVKAIQPGPVITRFEIEPAPGIRASVIVGLARDLARSLAVDSVRVVENIPGKDVVGIEIPNQNREIVKLVEGLSSREYEASDSPLALVIGKDIAGNPVVDDLIKMPHVLIAGTTGSGKSVCINALILSILYKATPEQVRMIMVDPKFLELSVYDGIPHLLAPVVTDMKKAANALRWCIAEMDRRFRLMAEVGVRNISGYNQKIKTAEKAGREIPDPMATPDGDESAPPLGGMPYIVVIVDELADLMMVAGKKIEEIIIRIAQRARAAGIHLVLATQRPSVDVVTGLIKANVPTRIAFQVSSRADSRTVLDQMGAEQLLGQGDMLFLPPGVGFPQRVHGSFVSDEEVNKIVGNLKASAEPVYLDEITEAAPGAPAEDGDNGEVGESDGESDPLYDQAVHYVTKSRRASISSVQRVLRVGYNRAARMIEAMEEAGVITPVDNGKREVLAPPPPEE